MEKKKLILIGGGNRGKTYVDIGKNLDKFELIAVAEPVKTRREHIAKKHNIPENMCFTSWEPLLALGKIADAAVIATMDQDHFAPTMQALELGYDLLLEKPVSNNYEECKLIEEAARKKGACVLVCHVLRYTPFFLAIKKLIDDGKLGRIMNIHHTEGVGNLHHSHSFVRGNWGNEGRASFMLLQKSCHDLDILQWLIDKECKKVQSFGHLSFFTKENMPEGATDRCFDGCPYLDTCPYSAKKLYFEREDGNWFRGSATLMHDRPEDEVVAEAMATTNYGKCAFLCDNDVVDHQIVNMEFEDDIIVSFTMSAFNIGGRKIRIRGTKGELIADTEEEKMILNDLITQQTSYLTISDVQLGSSILSGHGGGDTGIMNSFYEILCTGDDSKYSNISISVKNHKIAFAAEKARKEGRIVSLDEMI